MRTWIAGVGALLAVAGSAMAGDPVPGAFLADRGASAGVTLSGPTAGMNFLSTDGQISRLRLQGFWFRTAGMENEQNVGVLPVQFTASDTNPFVDNRLDDLSASYFGGGFRIDANWHLRGGLPGSGRADVGETIEIVNTSEVPISISFFQYSNFVLSVGAAPLDTLTIHGAGNNTATQVGNAGFVSETVVNPAPAGYLAGDAPTLLGLLTDGAITNANNTGSPAGPGNMAWIYQWDFNIPVGGSVTITKDKSLIPAPGAAALVGLGALAAGRRRRR